MDGYTKLPKKQLYLILGPLGTLILLLSLEVMMMTSDPAIFEHWMESNKAMNPGFDEVGLFNIFISGNISLYFQKIIVPIGLSLHSYFAFVKLRIGKLFVFMWSVLLIGSLAYTIIGLNFGNVFMYIYIVIYIVVFFTLVSLLGIINNNERS